MDFKNVPLGKDKAAEYGNGGGRNQTGVYRLDREDGTSVEQIALSVPAGDAFKAAGFVYVGPVPAGATATVKAPKPAKADQELQKQLDDSKKAQEAAEAARVEAEKAHTDANADLQKQLADATAATVAAEAAQKAADEARVAAEAKAESEAEARKTAEAAAKEAQKAADEATKKLKATGGTQ